MAETIEQKSIRELAEFLVGTHDVLEWLISLPREELDKFAEFLRNKPCVEHPGGHKDEIPIGDIREMLDVMQGMCEGLLYMASEAASAPIGSIFLAVKKSHN